MSQNQRMAITTTQLTNSLKRKNAEGLARTISFLERRMEGYLKALVHDGARYLGEAVVGGWTPPEDDRHRNEDEEGRQGVDEIGADRYLGILSKHLVLEEEDLVGDGQEGDDLRIEGGQTGHHGARLCHQPD